MTEIKRKKLDSATIISIVIVLALYVAVFVAEQFIPATSMLFTVIKKGATYALVAVSMNLLNGFTGIFSLGQAGFMLIGAYVYGIFTIPVISRMDVYQYYNGGLVQWCSSRCRCSWPCCSPAWRRRFWRC